jgi:hypothetical protein
MNPIVDKITVPATLAIILHPLAAYSLRACKGATRVGHCFIQNTS